MIAHADSEQRLLFLKAGRQTFRPTEQPGAHKRGRAERTSAGGGGQSLPSVTKIFGRTVALMDIRREQRPRGVAEMPGGEIPLGGFDLRARASFFLLSSSLSLARSLARSLVPATAHISNCCFGAVGWPRRSSAYTYVLFCIRVLLRKLSFVGEERRRHRGNRRQPRARWFG